jgi:hypothetical protein
MQLVFQCQNLKGECHAMTMTWLARSMERYGAPGPATFVVSPLDMLQDAYASDAFLSPGQTQVTNLEHERLALRFFGFAMGEADVESGTDSALGFRPLNLLAVHPGFSYFSVTGFNKGHCFGVHVHPPHWDVFDSNVGMLRYDSASDFRTGFRQHLMFNHMSQTIGEWVVARLKDRTESWGNTVSRIT